MHKADRGATERRSGRTPGIESARKYSAIGAHVPGLENLTVDLARPSLLIGASFGTTFWSPLPQPLTGLIHELGRLLGGQSLFCGAEMFIASQSV